MMNRLGFMPVPKCDPSQKGCFILLPQAHQKYFPAFNSTSLGFESKTTGSLERSGGFFIIEVNDLMNINAKIK